MTRDFRHDLFDAMTAAIAATTRQHCGIGDDGVPRAPANELVNALVDFLAAVIAEAAPGAVADLGTTADAAAQRLHDRIMQYARPERLS